MWESFIHFPIKMLLVIKNILTGTMDKKVDDNEGRANKGKRGMGKRTREGRRKQEGSVLPGWIYLQISLEGGVEAGQCRRQKA